MSLEEEFLQAMDRLDERSTACLKQHGVPDISLSMWPGPVGMASIETHPMNCFDFVPDRRRAFVMPVLSGGAFSDIVDLTAWFPDNPGRCWTRCYSGVPLGVDQLDRAELLGDPLLLHPTPLGWLRGNGEGVCILDWKMSSPALRCVPKLICEDVEFGRFVQDRLSAPALVVPEIHILMKAVA